MKQVLFLFSVLLVLAFSACQRPPNIGLEEGILDFSSDTVFFDTLFSSFESPSERLITTNNTGNNVKISAVWIEGGDNSVFSMIFDGLEGNRIEDHILADGDSVVIFIQYNSLLKDEFVRDRVLFQIGDEVQAVDIEAFVLDAVFYADDTLPTGITTFDPDKKYVIDGFLLVPSGGLLVIPAGTQVYFTPKKDAGFNLVSMLRSEGTIRVEGEAGNEVVFQGSRFGPRYDETPAQWRGIRLELDSRNNRITHALVKNALIGIEVDYGTNGLFPKLILKKSEIRNMGAFGILGIGYSALGSQAMIHSENTLVHNCQDATFAALGGGEYHFWNCTFANYSNDFRRSTPQLWLNNYDADALIAFPLEAEFVNCIVWGTEEEEIVPDSAEGVQDNFNYSFNYCILRTTLELKGSDNKISQDNDFPRFREPTKADAAERNYRPGANSPAINAGRTLPNINAYKDDLDGWTRGAHFDIGAYEYKPY